MKLMGNQDLKQQSRQILVNKFNINNLYISGTHLVPKVGEWVIPMAEQTMGNFVSNIMRSTSEMACVVIAVDTWDNLEELADKEHRNIIKKCIYDDVSKFFLVSNYRDNYIMCDCAYKIADPILLPYTMDNISEFVARMECSKKRIRNIRDYIVYEIDTIDFSSGFASVKLTNGVVVDSNTLLYEYIWDDTRIGVGRFATNIPVIDS